MKPIGCSYAFITYSHVFLELFTPCVGQVWNGRCDGDRKHLKKSIEALDKTIGQRVIEIDGHTKLVSQFSADRKSPEFRCVLLLSSSVISHLCLLPVDDHSVL